MPSSKKEDIVEFHERKSIKGLQPFSFKDREIFARLQRQKSLQECLETIINPSFRFGIILGESGCGKTSFLQAGLCPILNETESSHHGIYIRFSAQEPLTTIRKSFCQTLPLQESEVANLDLLALLKLGTEAVFPKPLVLFFDQFEQFLVHYQLKEDRKPFINDLHDWYVSELPVKVVISIREDLTGRLVELQKALGYCLAPQDVHRLEKFSPNEASKILKVIAEGENIRFDENFIEELAERELASREDGLISPVDLQILAWMVEGQKTEELRAFNRLAFQKLGGIEGLLHRFLDRTLEARIVPSQRQAAVKVLLALTDLDRQVRAGAFTISHLQNQLQASLSRAEVAEATQWLARGDVRLLTPFQEEDGTHYELAHERLIPVLMRLAGKELSEVDKANQLLERRVNEWLGNNYNPRFLLGIWDLWLIKQQKPYLTWGSKQQQKERLIATSWRRINRVTTVLTIVALVIVLSSGWLLYTPEGQIQQVRWQIDNPFGSSLERISDEKVAETAIAIAKGERWQLAFNVVNRYINRTADKASFIVELAKIVPQQEGSKQAQVLQKALTATEQINDPYDQSTALRAIAAAYGQLKNEAATQKGLKSALDITKQFKGTYDQSATLRAIAAAYGQLKNEAAAQEVLKLALVDITKQINNPGYQSYTLGEIVAACSQLKNKAAAQEGLKLALDVTNQINDLYFQAKSLSVIAAAYGQLGDEAAAQKVLKLALDITKQDKWLYSQAEALREIAAAYSQLEKEAAAQEVLKLALDITKQIKDSEYQLIVLRNIVAAYSQFKNEAAAQEVLKSALETTKQIKDSDSQSKVVSAIVAAYSQFKNEAAAQEVLKSALETTKQINNPGFQSGLLREIAAAYGQLKNEAAAEEVLKSALEAAKQINNSEAKLRFLIAIAAEYSQLEKEAAAQEVWKLALDINHPDSQSKVVSAIVAAYSQLKNEAAVQEGLKLALNITKQINNSEDKSKVVREIAAEYSQLKNEATAQEGLKLTLEVTMQINDLYFQSNALREIVAAYSQLKNEAAAKEGLKLVLDTTKQINKPSYQSYALREIAAVYVQLKDEAAAQEVLKLALDTTKPSNSAGWQDEALREIAAVYGQLKDEAAAQEGLKSTLDITNQIKYLSRRSVLSAIAKASAQTTNIEVTQAILHDTLLIAEVANDSSTLKQIAVQYAQQFSWAKALRALRNCPESEKVDALTQILTLWAEKNNPKLIDGAVVLELNVEGTSQAYTIDVSIHSPDRDCNHYADWWEVLSEDGELLYRQVFQENHINEQPFKNTGEPINIESDQVVIVRAHMHTNDDDDNGYEAMQAWKGSVDKGFKFIRLSDNFAKNVAKEDPQPPRTPIHYLKLLNIWRISKCRNPYFFVKCFAL